MAQENVLITFDVDYSQLDTAQEQLSKLGKVDAGSFSKIQNAITDTATDTQGLIKTFKEVGNASIKMGKTVEDAFANGIQDALDEAGVSVKEFETALKKTTQPATSLKKEMLALKEALARMKAEGKDTGKEFEALRARAGKLSDAIADANAEIKNAGSDTRGLDNVVGSISAVAGGYAAVQGAAALFGEENEDLQKTLVKVNGAMAIATGLQQALAAVQKEGALIKLKDAVATGAQTAATTLYTFVMGGATVATKIFRAVLLTTGIAAIVILIIGLVKAMSDYSEKTETAAEAQQRLADATANLNKALSEQIDFMNDVNALNVLRAKAAGKTEAEITAIERKAIADRIAIRQKAIDQAIRGGLSIAEITEQQNADITALQKFDLEQQIEFNKKKIAANKIAQEKIKKEREKAAADDKQKASEGFDNILKSLQDEEDQTRIHLENLQDIKNQDAEIEKSQNDAFAAGWKDFQESLTKSSVDEIAKRKKAAEEERAELIKNINTIVEVASRVSSVFTQLSELKTAQDEQEIASQRKRVEEDLRAGVITEKAAEQRHKHIDILERKARQRAAEREKRAAVFKAILAIPQAFLTGLTQSLPLAFVYAALAAVEAGIIASKPVPKFFKGKKGSYAGPGVVADMGSELVERDGRMFLYTKPTQTYLGAKDKVYTAAETRSIMHNSNLSTTQVRGGQPERLNYRELAAAIPKDTININIDKEFISESVGKGLSRINYMDRRYKSK